MQQARYRISELSERTGFSPPTIRYYEQVGLLPEPERTASGYRQYGEHDVQLLDFIARAKRLGLSLEEIDELLEFWDEGTCSVTREHLQQLMVEKVKELHREIEALLRFGQDLEEAYSRLTGHPPYERCDMQCGCPPDIRDDRELHRLQPLNDWSRLSARLEGLRELSEQAVE